MRHPHFVALAVLVLTAITTSACGILGEIPPKPVSNWTVAEARAFDEFDLYWLGESYQGLQLTTVDVSMDADDVKHVQFSYGEPSYFGDAASGSWLSPIEIDIQPHCGWSPEEYLSHYEDKSDPIAVPQTSGYVRHYDSDWSYLTLWSGESAISLETTPKTDLDIEQAARDLISIAEAGADPNPLPPPARREC